MAHTRKLEKKKKENYPKNLYTEEAFVYLLPGPILAGTPAPGL